MSEEGEASRVPGSNRRAVRDTYERIATHFAKTRPEPWSEVAEFLAGRQATMGLDVGVGNGRHAELLAGRCDRVLGLDLSHAALSEASRRAVSHGFEICLIAGGAAALPLQDSSVELAVYVATLHHLPTRSARVESLDELARVLGPGGRAIVSAWCVTHERFDAEAGFDTTIEWTLPDGSVVDRYYHIYDIDEFTRDIHESGLESRSTFESSGNCYALVGPDA